MILEKVIKTSKKGNELILKLRQSFRLEKHNVFTEVNKARLHCSVKYDRKKDKMNQFNKNICIRKKLKVTI